MMIHGSNRYHNRFVSLLMPFTVIYEWQASQHIMQILCYLYFCSPSLLCFHEYAVRMVANDGITNMMPTLYTIFYGCELIGSTIYPKHLPYTCTKSDVIISYHTIHHVDSNNNIDRRHHMKKNRKKEGFERFFATIDIETAIFLLINYSPEQ